MNTHTSTHGVHRRTPGSGQKQGSVIIQPSAKTFVELLSEHLTVACQLHLPYSDSAGDTEPHMLLFKTYREKGRAFLDKQKEAMQVLEEGMPATVDPEFLFTEEWRATVLFPGENRSLAKYVKLVFNRRDVWAACARKNEETAFGFSLEDKRNPYYLHLAYPGLTQNFEPLYLKVRDPETLRCVYYYITVKDVGKKNDILVSINAVPENDAPHALTVVAPLSR